VTLEELKKQFIVDEDILKTHLEPLIAKALNHCKLDKQGQVLILSQGLSAKDQIMLVLSARAIAAHLSSDISATVTLAELARFTRLPANQIRARTTQLMESRPVESPERGVLRAIPHKVEAFLDSISSPQNRKSARSA
jgi:hypothetical protein